MYLYRIICYTLVLSFAPWVSCFKGFIVLVDALLQIVLYSLLNVNTFGVCINKYYISVIHIQGKY